MSSDTKKTMGKCFSPVVLLFTLATILFFGCGCKERANGRAAPDFMLIDLEGSRFYLSAQKGKILILNFWSVHCLPCVQEMPRLQKLQEEYSGKDVKIIGICTDPGEAGYIGPFLRGLGVTYPVLMDRDSTAASLYEVKALPTTYIIDRQGMIQHHTVGYREEYINRYASQLDEIIHRK